MPRTIALIVAGGRGSRFGHPTPKQYLTLAGLPVIRRAALAFLAHPRIDGVRIVHGADAEADYRAALDGLDPMSPATGGAERQDSVRNGLESLENQDVGAVLIHDAARPFVDAETISRTLDALDDADGAIAAIPVADTVKRVAPGDRRITATIDRAELWRAQTPQSFRFEPILAAHRAVAGERLTDDAAVAERAGLKVVTVMGSEDNFKITTREDLLRAEALLLARAGETRVAGGFDVHRFGPGDRVILGGVAIPHDFGLEGHSDADVALHALTDALLGTIAAGDIGTHFPPTDARWRGAESGQFLRHAAKLVAERGGVITHLDVTIICERPKIGPHRAAITARIAELLGLAQDRVSVKATTTEGLGFTGRREGIAAQATATVRLP